MKNLVGTGFILLVLSGCVSSGIYYIEGKENPRHHRTNPSVESELLIFSLNLNHDFPEYRYKSERMKKVVEFIDGLKPDLVFLQEVSIVRGENLGEVIAEAIGYTMVYAGANGSSALIGFEEGEAILTPHRIIDYERIPLHPDPGVFEDRVVLRALIDTPSGLVQAYCTHFSHGRERSDLREGQAEHLLQIIASSSAEAHTVLAGDFNAAPESAVYRLIIRSGLTDAFESVKGKDSSPTAGISSVIGIDESQHRRIDYIFTRASRGKDAVIKEGYTSFSSPVIGETGSFWISDHVGLVANIQFTNAQK